VTGLAVAFVLGTTSGGTGRHVAMLARGCANAGARVRVFGPAEVRRLFVAPGTDAVGFSEVRITDRPRPVGDTRAVLRLRRLLVATSPDVVHAHGLRAGGFAALATWRLLPIGRRGRTRPALVVTVHNAPPPKSRLAVIYAALERLVARRADVVLCVSPDLSANMRRLGAEHVQPAVVAADLPASAAVSDLRADVSAGERPVVFGAGRLTPQKGFDILLAAAATWQGRQPLPVVTIVGDGPMAGGLASQARRLGVDARFLGTRDDVAGLLATADVFVLPSRWEGQPLVLQEALRAGCAIIAASVGGVRDLTGDDAALLVPAGDAAALGQAVLEVLDHPDLARSLRAAAASRAATLPTQADAVAVVLELYDRLLRGPVRARIVGGD
jgi:glycosyltransferase involved in cell wall biosynthesis